MVANRKTGGRAFSIPGGIASGVGIAMLWTLAGAAMLAKLIDMETMAEESMGYGVMGILLLGSFLGAAFACGKTKRQRALTSILTGAGYYLGLLALTALFFGGQYSGMGVTALVILAGCGTTLLLGMGKGRTRSAGHHRKIR